MSSRDSYRNAIDRAVGRMEALGANLPAATAWNLPDQAESALAYIERTEALWAIVSDLMVDACIITASLGNGDLTKYDADMIREPQSIRDALRDAREWAEMHRHEVAA